MNQQKYSMPMKAHHGGFSMIEILVVIGAIGILVGIAVPAYNGYRERAQIAEAMSDLKRIEAAIIALATNTGQWPMHLGVGVTTSGPTNEIYDLNAANAGLVIDDAGTPYPNWNGPYIPSVPLDPWGKNYYFDQDYDVNGVTMPVIGSFGPDKCCPNNYNTGDDVIIVFPLK